MPPDLCLKIVNWDAYNLRTNVKTSSWLRFQHDFFENPNFYSLTTEEKLVWVYLLCERSKRARPEAGDFFTVNTQHFHRVTGLNTTALQSCILKLKKERVLETRTPRGRFANAAQTHPTNERTNVTDGRNETDERTNEKTKNPSGTDLQSVASRVLGARKGRFDDLTKAKMAAFIAAYCDAYKKRYGSNPEGTRDPALVGKIGGWIQTVSGDRASQLVQVFLQIEHKHILDNCHSLWDFFRHLNRIGNALTTGVEPMGIDWAKIFGDKHGNGSVPKTIEATR